MTKRSETLPSTPTVQVIERMFNLLEVLASREEPVSLKEISEKTGLHPSTAHRILNDLTIGRFVDRPEAGSYRLGMRLLELGNLVKARLSVRQGDEVVYVERVSSSGQMMRVVQAVGTRAPLHATSVGKVFLADDGSEAANAYAQRVGLTRLTDHTLTDPAVLSTELEQVRSLGYAMDREEAEKGVSCIAAGIRDDEGTLVAGLSVSAPSDRLDAAWAAKVRSAAEHVSSAMGYHGRD